MKHLRILALALLGLVYGCDKAAPPPPEQSGEKLPARSRPAAGERGNGR